MTMASYDWNLPWSDTGSFRTTSSTSSASSTSSVSTFSDISTSTPLGAKPNSKTNAFFVSPFNTRAHSPVSDIATNDNTDHLQSSPPIETRQKSLTNDFFSTPVRPPSPPPALQFSSIAKPKTVHPSRIFPSRYTSIRDHSENSFALVQPDFVENFSSSQDRETSFTPSPTSASFYANTDRLPTPPPPPPLINIAVHDEEPTPRPSNREPSMAYFPLPAPEHIQPSAGMLLSAASSAWKSLFRSPSPASDAHPTPPSTPSPLDASFSLPTETPLADSASQKSWRSDDDERVYTPRPTPTTQLELLKPLGQGAFSDVWLARDLSHEPLALVSKRSIRGMRSGSIQGRRNNHSLSRNSSKSRSRNAPVKSNDSLSRKSSLDLNESLSRNASLKKFKARVGGIRPRVVHSSDRDDAYLGASLSRPSSTRERRSSLSLALSAAIQSTRLVAVKMTPRGVLGRTNDDEERTRVGFVREVEVLRHICHPNITPLLASLSTPSHHILVLPYLPGGDLLSLVNTDEAWGSLRKSVLQRIWCELCKGIGWMHSVGLVHRDVKLENILLTIPLFSSTSSSPLLASQDITLPPDSVPLIKLTDFGLSRFIELAPDGTGELLSTRCGSEAYAAPELVMGGTRVVRVSGEATNKPREWRGVYDGRETDAWACGVVLYVLLVRELPFGEGVGVDGAKRNRIGSERATGGSNAAERRQWLMRIAKGEWSWPEEAWSKKEINSLDVPAVIGENETMQAPGTSGSLQSLQIQAQTSDNREVAEEEELCGATLIRSAGARRIVARLLVRNPKKRAGIADLWDDPWMGGTESEGVDLDAPSPTTGAGVPGEDAVSAEPSVWRDERGQRDLFDSDDEVESWEGMSGDEFEDDEEDCSAADGADFEAFEDEDGWLLDQDGIDNIARQEVI